MKTTQTLPNRPARLLARALLLCGSTGLFLAGCATQPESHVISTPPPAAPTSTVATQTTTSPVVVTQTPATATSASTIIVTQTAPPPRQDVHIARPEQPSPAHAWIDGYWTWRNERYEWMAGHWSLPPNSTAQWIAPRWEKEAGGYRFYEGYWKS